MSSRRRGAAIGRQTPWWVIALIVVALIVGALLVLREEGGGPGEPVARGTPTATRAGAPTAGRGADATPGSDAAYQVYFTTPRYRDNDPLEYEGGPDEKLVAMMDRATRTLDVAAYDFDLRNVAEAMARAAGRGVRVRMVTDTDTIEDTDNAAVVASLAVVKKAKIPIVDDRRGPIMHHKFTVVDGEWVSTGSMNYTSGDAYRLNNNLIVARSKQLAQNYTAEFEKMFVEHQFGPNKTPGSPFPRLTLGASAAENYFAPEDEVGDKIVKWVEGAQQSIHFMAFSFTHDDIGEAMLARAKAGVELQGVFESTGSNTQFSEFGRMKKANADVYQDGSPYAMHHKVILLDGRRVIFGSFNFSQNADTDNDENLLVIDDTALAAQFEAEFQRMVELAKSPPR